jgi:hypothetical protein
METAPQSLLAVLLRTRNRIIDEESAAMKVKSKRIANANPEPKEKTKTKPKKTSKSVPKWDIKATTAW